MRNKITIGLGVTLLSLGGIGALAFTKGQGVEKPRVVCCGECQPGDDCLSKCKVEGRIPEGTKVTCCGKCQNGDNCLEKCASTKRSCCEAK